MNENRTVGSIVQSNDNANMNSTREMNHISGDETSVNCITEASQRSWSGDGKENLASSLKMEPKNNEGVFSQPVAGNPESGLSFTTPFQDDFSFQPSTSIGLYPFPDQIHISQNDSLGPLDNPLLNSFALSGSITKRGAVQDLLAFTEKEIDMRSSTTSQRAFGLQQPFMGNSINEMNLSEVPVNNSSLQQSIQIPVFQQSYVTTNQRAEYPLMNQQMDFPPLTQSANGLDFPPMNPSMGFPPSTQPASGLDFSPMNQQMDFSVPGINMIPESPDVHLPPQPIFSPANEHLPPQPIFVSNYPSNLPMDSFNPSAVGSGNSGQFLAFLPSSTSSLQSKPPGSPIHGTAEPSVMEPAFYSPQSYRSHASPVTSVHSGSVASMSPSSFGSGSPGSVGSPRRRNTVEGKKRVVYSGVTPTGENVQSVVIKMKDPKPGRKWTPEEDELLLRAVEIEGIPNWVEIAKHVPGRNNTQVNQRYMKVLRPGIKKGPWSTEEDSALLAAIKQFGENWDQVATMVEGRSAAKCRERYQNYIGPNVRKGNWTPEEDEKLLKLQEQWGNRWSAISQQFDGRTSNDIRTRFNTLDRLRNRNHYDRKM